jgi:hypothetical protein
MLTVEHLEFKMVDDRGGLVVAADVLANSLAYLFKTRPPEEQFKALNTPEAFQRHMLKDCLDSFWDLSVVQFHGHILPSSERPGLIASRRPRNIRRTPFSFSR